MKHKLPLSVETFFDNLALLIAALLLSFTLIMPRAQKSGKARHDPLIVQLDEDAVEAKYGRVSLPGKRKKSKRQSEEDENADVCSITPVNVLV